MDELVSTWRAGTGLGTAVLSSGVHPSMFWGDFSGFPTTLPNIDIVHDNIRCDEIVLDFL